MTRFEDGRWEKVGTHCGGDCLLTGDIIFELTRRVAKLEELLAAHTVKDGHAEVELLQLRWRKLEEFATRIRDAWLHGGKGSHPGSPYAQIGGWLEEIDSIGRVKLGEVAEIVEQLRESLRHNDSPDAIVGIKIGDLRLIMDAVG